MKLEFRVKVSWWVRPYIQSLALFSCLTGMEPDFDKVKRTVLRGVKAVRT